MEASTESIPTMNDETHVVKQEAVQPLAASADTHNEEAVEEDTEQIEHEDDATAAAADDEEAENEDEEENYAAEYRSLLFRVAEMESQEEQRMRQRGVTLRMAQREAKLMSRVVRQQQVFLAAQATQKKAISAPQPAAAPGSDIPHALTSSDAVARHVMGDAQLTSLAYQAERTQQHRRQLVDAASQLLSYTQTLERDQADDAQLCERAEEVLATMCDEKGGDVFRFFSSSPSEAGDPLMQSPLSPPSSSSRADTWQKHSGSLVALGGTLAKVHTMFQDDASRANMAVVAAHLSHLGRQSQSLLQQLQRLTAQEAALESALQCSRSATVEWGVYAAHVQQAREMKDLHSTVTVAEMRAMAVRKLLLRRRQELQSALTVTLLRMTERSAGTLGSASSPSTFRFTSPAAEVAVERVKAVADDCAQRESLRDRLWHELLFLKKCARRELGAAWVAQVESAALCRSAAAAGADSADVRRLAALVTENLRRSTYDGIARVLHMAAQPPPAATSFVGDGETVDSSVSNEAGASEVTSPVSPLASLPPRVRVLALVEGVQTRVNAIASLLMDNATHWQRIVDARVEAEWVSGPHDETWTRVADALLQRCSSATTPATGASTESGEDDSAYRSLLLDLEQQLLETMRTAEATLTTAVNAALAELHTRCMKPLTHLQQEVLLLVRLLQLADEAVADANAECHHEGDAGDQQSTATTTAALENVVRRLQEMVSAPTQDETAAATTAATADAIDALLSTTAQSSSPSALPSLRLPRCPYDTEELQSAVRTVSAAWQEALQADVTQLRSGVTAKQANLDLYAPYSMAEVPALLEKTRVAVGGLKEQLAALTTQNGHAALLSSQLREQRQVLAQRVGPERAAVTAAMQAARERHAAVHAEVMFLRAAAAVMLDETSARHAVLAAEAAEWAVATAGAEDCVMAVLEATTAAAVVIKTEPSALKTPAEERQEEAAALKAEAEGEEEEAEGEYDNEGGDTDDDVKREEGGDAVATEEGSSNYSEHASATFHSAQDEEEEEEGEGEPHQPEEEQQNDQDEEQQQWAEGAEEDAGPSGEEWQVNEDAPLTDDASQQRESQETAEEGSNGAASTLNIHKVTSDCSPEGQEEKNESPDSDDGDVPQSQQHQDEEEEEGEGEEETVAEDALREGEEDEESLANEDVADTATEKENEEQVPAASLVPSPLPKQDEEASLRSEEDGSRGILGDSFGILGAGGVQTHPMPVLPPPPPPPPAASNSGVLGDNNPFYSGFGFGEE